MAFNDVTPRCGDCKAVMVYVDHEDLVNGFWLCEKCKKEEGCGNDDAN
jgi:hypothetical protein